MVFQTKTNNPKVQTSLMQDVLFEDENKAFIIKL